MFVNMNLMIAEHRTKATAKWTTRCMLPAISETLISYLNSSEM